MTTSNLEKVSSDLFLLLVALNKNIFNPHELMKNTYFPPSHGRVLFYLIHKGDSAISEIGRDLVISKPNMTPIIDKLESEGFISRFTDPNDRRIIRVTITSKATDFFNKQQLIGINTLSNKLSPLTSDDMHKLSLAISDMKEVLLKL